MNNRLEVSGMLFAPLPAAVFLNKIGKIFLGGFLFFQLCRRIGGEWLLIRNEVFRSR